MAKFTNIRWPKGKWRGVKEMLKRVHPYQAPTSAAKLILLEISENKELERAVLSAAYQRLATLSDAKIPSPDPVRAPVHDDKQTNKQPEEDARSAAEREAAQLIVNLDWFGAKLVSGDTPEACARRLVRGHPDADVPAELYLAQDWLVRHPKRRKQKLGDYLAYWMGPGRKKYGGGDFVPSKPSKPTQASLAGFDDNQKPSSGVRRV